MEIQIYGRYGELFKAESIGEDSYLVNCFELRIKDARLTKNDFDDLLNKYQKAGEPNFCKSSPDLIKSRALNMHRWYCHIRVLYPSSFYTNLESNLPEEILQLLADVEVLGLSDEQYLEWFIKGENQETSEQFIDYILNLKKKYLK